MATLLSETALDDAARYTAGLAAKLEQVGDDLTQRQRHLVWRGPAATRFGTRTEPVHAAVQARSAQLTRAAHLLRAAADRVRQERSVLVGDQNLVEAILRGEPDPAAFLRSVGWTEPALPPAGDTGWRDLARRVVAGAERGASR